MSLWCRWHLCRAVEARRGEGGAMVGAFGKGRVGGGKGARGLAQAGHHSFAQEGVSPRL